MLTARIVERAALRFTPAGLPAIDMSLRHDSQIAQAASVRKVGFEIRARAIGAVTESLRAAELGVDHVFAGFLGAQRNGRGIVFHIQSIELNPIQSI
ncbi:MAG: primosomal replication protein N [Pseudomonadota bacterium]|nr:primosomal replication protein N [Pseudomonadota bacterium]